MKRPSLQWYPDDWLNDLAVRQCSPLARAVWIDMICLMHQGSPYGYLRGSAGPLPCKFLASTCRVTVKQIQQAISELEQNGVFSRDEEGVIYSRRMVKDDHTRLLRAGGGYRSVDHPNTLKPKGKGTHEGYPDSTHNGYTQEDVDVDVSEKQKKSGRLNGKSDVFDFAVWFETRMAKHPNPRDRNIAAQYLSDRLSAGTIEIQAFTTSHDAWCEYWKADNSERYAPSLAKFVFDKWDLKLPPSRGQPKPSNSAALELAKRRQIERDRDSRSSGTG